MKLPHLPMTGGCLCHRHRYRVNALPLTLYACHCSACQTQSTSAFGMSMPVLRAEFECEGQSLRAHERVAASGRIVTGRYCGDCGTRLYNEASRTPDVVNMKPGTLDDTCWLDPVGHLWLASAQPWFRPPSDALCYQG
jgi:hypothetical protein